MEGKKISFGFKKVKKTEIPTANPDDEKKEYIDCLEEKSIKLIGGEESKKPELVIPMKPNTLSVSERMRKVAEDVESADLKPQDDQVAVVDGKLPKRKDNETIEEQATRELLEQVANKKSDEESKILNVALNALPSLEGSKEPTLEDYDNVPVSDFGLAMLRGMGWKPGQEKKYPEPELRPKGLGLGAEKTSKKSASTNDKDELKLASGCCVKLNKGKLVGSYAKVMGFDEESGRVIIDLANNKGNVSVNENMIDIIPKSEYDKQFRVINNEKYEEYKRREAENHRRHEPRNCPMKRKRSTEDLCDKCKEEVKREKQASKQVGNPASSFIPLREPSPTSRAALKSKDKQKNIPVDKPPKKNETNKTKNQTSPVDSDNDNSSQVASKSKEKDKKRKKERRGRSYETSEASSLDEDVKSRTEKSYSKRRKYAATTDTEEEDSYRRDSDKKRKGKKKRRDRSRSRPRQRNMKKSR